MVLEAIRDYDANGSLSNRADFLAFLRQESKSTGMQMPKLDLTNHLLNNL